MRHLTRSALLGALPLAQLAISLASPLAIPLAVSLAVPLAAQIGGNGSDGALLVNTSTTLDTTLKPNGFDFTRLLVAAGTTLTIRGSHPAVLRVQSDARVDGTIDLNGSTNQWGNGGLGGPGGYDGGSNLTQSRTGGPGKGPGGGQGGYIGFGIIPASGGSHATPGGLLASQTYGSSYPFDLRGGSGGGAEAVLYPQGPPALGGGGGGGTLVILADGAITVQGSIRADGAIAGGGAGAGGSILLRSMSSTTITGVVSSRGGTSLNSRGGDGFVRIDQYGNQPVVTGIVGPLPELVRLPDLRSSSAPVQGSAWRLTMAACPNDRMTVFLATRGAAIPVPPFGMLELDLFAGVVPIGVVPIAATGVDPMAELSLLLPRDPLLIGLRIHAQAVNHVYTATGRPCLTNGLHETIQ